MVGSQLCRRYSSYITRFVVNVIILLFGELVYLTGKLSKIVVGVGYRLAVIVGYLGYITVVVVGIRIRDSCCSYGACIGLKNSNFHISMSFYEWDSHSNNNVR